MASKKKKKQTGTDKAHKDEYIKDAEMRQKEQEEKKRKTAEEEKDTSVKVEFADDNEKVKETAADAGEEVKEEEKKAEKEEKEDADKDALKDRLLRLQAEFINYKKRVEKESLELASYLKAELVKDFLPVLDDFKHMIEKVQKEHNDIKAVMDGIEMIFKKNLQLIEKFGVKQMESLDKEFDPEYHEALMVQPVAEKEKDNKVIQVYQEGYMLNDRVVRPAKVIVGKYEEKN